MCRGVMGGDITEAVVVVVRFDMLDSRPGRDIVGMWGIYHCKGGLEVVVTHCRWK